MRQENKSRPIHLVTCDTVDKARSALTDLGVGSQISIGQSGTVDVVSLQADEVDISASVAVRRDSNLAKVLACLGIK